MKALTQILNEAILLLTMSTIAFFSISNIAFAQIGNETKQALITRSFETEKGNVIVYLPGDLQAGDVISGTVSIEATGKNENKKQKNADQLNGYVVEIAGQPVNTRSGIGTWSLPADRSSTPILLKDTAGKIISSADPVVFNPTQNGYLINFEIPSYVISDKPVTIPGNFDGRLENLYISFNDEPAKIIAESPRGAVVQTAGDWTGPVDININEDGTEASGKCNVLNVALSADRVNLKSGQSATINMVVSGLEGLDETVPVLITNNTPGVISMPGGTSQRFSISPDQVNSDGVVEFTFRVTANVPGVFSLTAQIFPSEKYEGASTQIDRKKDGMTFSSPDTNTPVYSSVEMQINQNGTQDFLTGVFPANILASITVVLAEDELRKLRNKARGLPENTPVQDSDPNDEDAPYSRPVPNGLKGKDYERGSYWKDADRLLKKAKSEVKRAQEHKGEIEPGIPGFGTIGLTSPSRTISHHSRGCTEYVYNFAQRYTYINDVTLVKEEQLSPSFEYFVAKGENKINITSTTTGWEIGGSVSAGIKGVEIGINGKYGESTTKITGGSTSKIKGRHLWFFHIGRLYLARKAYLRINYEYHYEVCTDGSTSNWVVVTYEDNWYYRYYWIETLVVAFKDDEGNFHKIKDFWLQTKTVEEKHESYETDGLEREHFDNPDDWDFFPEVQ